MLSATKLWLLSLAQLRRADTRNAALERLEYKEGYAIAIKEQTGVGNALRLATRGGGVVTRLGSDFGRSVAQRALPTTASFSAHQYHSGDRSWIWEMD